MQFEGRIVKEKKFIIINLMDALLPDDIGADKTKWQKETRKWAEE